LRTCPSNAPAGNVVSRVAGTPQPTPSMSIEDRTESGATTEVLGVTVGAPAAVARAPAAEALVARTLLAPTAAANVMRLRL
jgi:hypothetical protein